jgi:hypothetical protein
MSEAFSAADVDIVSAYLAAFSAAGAQDFLEATSLDFSDAADDLRTVLCEAAAGDLSLVFDPGRVRRLASIVAKIVPDRDILPVATADDELPGFHSWREVHRAEGTRARLPFAGPDLFVSALRTAKVPEIVWAVSWRAVGRQPSVRQAAPIYERMRAGPSGPVVGVARLRNRQKTAARSANDPETVATEERRAAASRLVGLAAGYGLFGHTTPGTEERGEWWAPLISAAVTSTVRMWIATAEHILAEHGITVASRDTDGLLLRCTPEQWHDLGAVLARFDHLDPFGDGSPFWKVLRDEGRPLWAVVLRVKRYVLFTRNDDGSVQDVVEFSEHALAGSVVDPPCLSGRLPNGKHRWAREVAEDAARRSIGSDYELPDHEWDRFPMIERHEARSVDAVADVGRSLRGIRPFGRYLRACREYAADAMPLALDDGSDLSDWVELPWHGPDGGLITVSVHMSKDGVVLIRTLGELAKRWLVPHAQDTSPIICHPDMIRLAGRAGPALDALRADRETDSDEHRVVYKPEDGRPIVERAARKLGPRAFGRITGLPPRTACNVAAGQASNAMIRQALAALRAPASLVPSCETSGCDAAIPRAGQRFCGPCAKDRRREQDRAWRARRRAARSPS